MKVTVSVDTILLREQRDWLLSLPSNDNTQGLINMLDAMLDIAELGEQL